MAPTAAKPRLRRSYVLNPLAVEFVARGLSRRAVVDRQRCARRPRICAFGRGRQLDHTQAKPTTLGVNELDAELDAAVAHEHAGVSRTRAQLVGIHAEPLG